MHNHYTASLIASHLCNLPERQVGSRPQHKAQEHLHTSIQRSKCCRLYVYNHAHSLACNMLKCAACLLTYEHDCSRSLCYVLTCLAPFRMLRSPPSRPVACIRRCWRPQSCCWGWTQLRTLRVWLSRTKCGAVWCLHTRQRCSWRQSATSKLTAAVMQQDRGFHWFVADTALCCCGA